MQNYLNIFIVFLLLYSSTYHPKNYTGVLYGTAAYAFGFGIYCIFCMRSFKTVEVPGQSNLAYLADATQYGYFVVHDSNYLI